VRRRAKPAAAGAEGDRFRKEIFAARQSIRKEGVL
jgi:hypothetical protein